MAAFRQCWSIYAIEKPIPGRSIVDRVLFGIERHHSFLAIVDERGPKGPAIIDELHFVSFRDPDRAQSAAATRAFEGAQLISESVCLGDSFRRASRWTGFERFGGQLKAIGREQRSPLGDLRFMPYVSGEPSYIAALWNNALEVALAINRSDVPFRSLGVWRDAQNCRTGTSEILRSIGFEFWNPLPKRERGDMTRVFRDALQTEGHVPPEGASLDRLIDRKRELYAALRKEAATFWQKRKADASGASEPLPLAAS